MIKAGSKLNIYIKNINVINNGIQRFILNTIFLSFGVLSFFYVLFLGNMIQNIIERRDFEARARVLSSEVRDLELSYLSMSNDIDMALSYSMGFKEIKTAFSVRKSLGFGQDQFFDDIRTVKNDL